MNIIEKLKSFRADWIDVAFIKIGVAAATLLLAKLWAPILSLEWYWYLIILVVFAIKPVKTVFKWMEPGVSK